MTDRRDIPDDNGKRASFNPETGAVRGSGVGAGGGQRGEDFENDPASGGAVLPTGGESTDHSQGSKGPPHVGE